jgi:hypothetical protein
MTRNRSIIPADQVLSDGDAVWKAGCGKTRTSGADGEQEPLARRNPGTARRSDPCPDTV